MFLLTPDGQKERLHHDEEQEQGKGFPLPDRDENVDVPGQEVEEEPGGGPPVAML